MKTKLIIVPALLFTLVGGALIGVSSNKNLSVMADESYDPTNLNNLKDKVSRTFDLDYLPAGTETSAVLRHQNYKNGDHRKKDLATSANIFLSNNAYSVANTSLNTTGQFSGTGCFERVSNGGASGLALRSNTDRNWLDATGTSNYSINFFVKNVDVDNTGYYSGLVSFRGNKGTQDSSLLYNIDIGTAGFWVNKINSADASDNTYRKYITSSTGAWDGRTTFNGFDNGSFGTKSSTADAMKKDQWYMITYNFSDTDGITIYRDGIKKVSFTPSCKLVINSGDSDNFTVATIVSKLRSIMQSKNAVIMFMRGQSSTRPVGSCIDEVTIFNNSLTEEEMLLWKNSYNKINYFDGDTQVKAYVDMAKNLVPEYILPDKGTNTFYKWATDQKLLTQISSEVPYEDINAYADYKDENGVSDGAKILADDIIALDTCTEYEDVDEWQGKIDMLDATDANYVNKAEFTDATGTTYSIAQKLAYMKTLNAYGMNTAASIELIFGNGEIGNISLAIILFATSITLIIIVLKRKRMPLK